ncbi:hypothetical protein [Candidatus Electrothrix sp.]|uniref:hypothetical protein n=1 Tax=Candidatus Electrothrix sp. TaxID=2170559 RepID=UPI004056CAD4
MSNVQWKPVENALTTPRSHRAQVVPHNTPGYDEMAADISALNPNYNAELVRSLAPLMMEWVQTQLINGNRVTLEDAFSFHLTISGRLDSPDSPLPDDEDLINVNIYATRPFVEKVRKEARLERLPMSKKQPLITSAEDTKLKLTDVLNPDGVLHLTGNNLFFNEDDPDCSCVLQGTRSGQTKQTTFASISNSEILLVPDIPAQPNPWNNEYTVSISTQYTEHGTVRTGTFGRKLRTPLSITLGNGDGILTNSANTPYVTVDGGNLAAEEMVRIQVVQDLHEGLLFFNLLDMRENGEQGEPVRVSSNSPCTLPGFTGSGLTSLDLTVQKYSKLMEMIRNDYGGRLVDVLKVESGA